MIKSMTGYGRQKGENERREVQVEIKSVNHRYLDLNVKVPRHLFFPGRTHQNGGECCRGPG